MRPMYKNVKGGAQYILAACTKCGRVNYVEQHGTTAKCRCSREWTEHRSIPYRYRSLYGICEVCQAEP